MGAGRIPLSLATGSLGAARRGSGHFPHPRELETTDQVSGNNSVMRCAFHWNVSPLQAKVPCASELYKHAVLLLFDSTSASRSVCTPGTSMATSALCKMTSWTTEGRPRCSWGLSNCHCAEYERKHGKTHLLKKRNPLSACGISQKQSLHSHRDRGLSSLECEVGVLEQSKAWDRNDPVLENKRFTAHYASKSVFLKIPAATTGTPCVWTQCPLRTMLWFCDAPYGHSQFRQEQWPEARPSYRTDSQSGRPNRVCIR